jgi:prepilin-type N-terminal cleavage/methylation domain-containing protein
VKRKEHGFTLIEIVAALAITASVAGAAALGVSQVVRDTERNNEHITAINQVRNAGYWLTSDAQKAQRLTADGLLPPDFLIIAWTEWGSGNNHEITYSLEDMPGTGLKQLRRSESINEDTPITNTIAQYIDPDPGKTSCEITDARLTMTVTATVSNGSRTESETRVFVVFSRPDQ